MAEDQSFSKEDAIAFAQRHQVSIYSLIPKDSSALQNVLYLAERTGDWASTTRATATRC